MDSFKTKWMLPVAALIVTLSIGGAAFAATGASTDSTAATSVAPSSTATTSGGKAAAAGPHGQGGSQQRSDETLLTGDVLAKVEAAALAKIGSDAKIIRAETDVDGNAKYEVHAVKADGAPVVVYVDDSYTVVEVETLTGRGARDGNGRMGSRMGQRSDETPLTGDTLAKVQAAALAAAGSGSTLIRAETDADGNAKYEAHVTKADGTCVTVYLDESFKVVKTETAPQAGAGGHGDRSGARGGAGRGEGDCARGTNGTGGTSNTTGTVTNS
jgi:uncharacterized membrane protein YkoI